MARQDQIFLTVILFFASQTCNAAFPDSIAVLVGSPLRISCASSFVPPTWSWVGPKQSQPKTLAFSGTQSHPSLKDSRFSFSRSDTSYVLRISNVRLIDAGTINCQGDSLHQTLLNVIR